MNRSELDQKLRQVTEMKTIATVLLPGNGAIHERLCRLENTLAFLTRVHERLQARNSGGMPSRNEVLRSIEAGEVTA
ncbi:MAG: hypothetical protein RLZZ142_2050 [Verrucomicrobiota bacterium]|jgi:hypothetical protein